MCASQRQCKCEDLEKSAFQCVKWAGGVGDKSVSVCERYCVCLSAVSLAIFLASSTTFACMGEGFGGGGTEREREGERERARVRAGARERARERERARA